MGGCGRRAGLWSFIAQPIGFFSLRWIELTSFPFSPQAAAVASYYLPELIFLIPALTSMSVEKPVEEKGYFALVKL